MRRLSAQGLYLILELHSGASGDEKALGQEAMPDADHSVAVWSSVAIAFRPDASVLFELFNEPHDVSWNCWKSGCTMPGSWRSAGMQTLADAVRANSRETAPDRGRPRLGQRRHGLARPSAFRPAAPTDRGFPRLPVEPVRKGQLLGEPPQPAQQEGARGGDRIRRERLPGDIRQALPLLGRPLAASRRWRGPGTPTRAARTSSGATTPRPRPHTDLPSSPTSVL